MKRVIALLIMLILMVELAISKNGDDDSRIKSYDTTYVDERDSSLLMRQIYINDIFNKKEVYILYRMQGDSIVKKNRWEQKY